MDGIKASPHVQVREARPEDMVRYAATTRKCRTPTNAVPEFFKQGVAPFGIARAEWRRRNWHTVFAARLVEREKKKALR